MAGRWAVNADAGLPLAIGIAGPLPPPPGGMANQTAQLAERLRAEGLDVTVVRSNAPYRPALVGHLRGVRAAFRMAPYLLRLWQAAGRCDVMHVMANSGLSFYVFAAPAIGAARLRGIPVVLNYRGGEAADFFAGHIRFVRGLLSRCAAIVVPSAYLGGVFAEHGFEPEVLPNAIDAARFRAAPRPGGHDAPALLLPRALEPIYGPDVAIDALAELRRELPGAHLTLAGEGAARAALEQQAQALGIADAVHFAGSVAPEAMPALYAASDIVVNPARVDNFPAAVLEAMAAGRPLVATRVGEVAAMTDDGQAAALVPPEDPAALAQAVLSVWRDQELAARRVAAGLAAVTRYGWPQAAARWLAVYRRVTAAQGEESANAASR